MDKENLYYVVQKGSNDRILNIHKDVFIGDLEAANREIEFWSKFNKVGYEAISIAEYEEKFMEKDVIQ